MASEGMDLFKRRSYYERKLPCAIPITYTMKLSLKAVKNNYEIVIKSSQKQHPRYFRSKEEILEYVDDIIDMHITYMPPSASVTPQIHGSAEEIIDIVCEFGRPEMIWVVKYKPTDGCG